MWRKTYAWVNSLNSSGSPPLLRQQRPRPHMVYALVRVRAERFLPVCLLDLIIPSSRIDTEQIAERAKNRSKGGGRAIVRSVGVVRHRGSVSSKIERAERSCEGGKRRLVSCCTGRDGEGGSLVFTVKSRQEEVESYVSFRENSDWMTVVIKSRRGRSRW